MRILRHEIPVEGTYHRLEGVPTSTVLMSVAPSRTAPEDLIDLWAIHRDFDRGAVGVYVLGTGSTLPPQLETQNEEFARTGTLSSHDKWRQFIGTVVTPAGFVWHVFRGPLQ